MKKAWKVALVAASLLAAAFVLVDYLELGMRLHMDGERPYPVRLRFIDKDTEAPMAGVTAECYYKGEKMYWNGPPQSDDSGCIRSLLLVGYGGVKTRLFDKRGPSPREVENWPVEFVFEHRDYLTKRMTARIGDVKSETVVLMEPATD